MLGWSFLVAIADADEERRSLQPLRYVTFSRIIRPRWWQRRGTVVTATEIYLIFTNFTAIIPQSGRDSNHREREFAQARGLHGGGNLAFSA